MIKLKKEIEELKKTIPCGREVAVSAGITTIAGHVRLVDPGSYAKAILNILGDFSEENVRLQNTQKAIQNILEDAETEKFRLAEQGGEL